MPYHSSKNQQLIMKFSFLFFCIFFFYQHYLSTTNDPITNANCPPIVVRHDRADAEYIALGQQFPSVGKVGKRGGDGTLIAEQWVLTAAHVAEGMHRRLGDNLKVYFENEDTGYLVKNVFLHPDFVPMGGSDIALLELDQPVKNIVPSALYTHEDELGKDIVIVGHGDFKTGKESTWKVDGIKRGATNTIDKTTPSSIIFDFDAPPAGTELEGTAGRGDSGGPAFILVNDQPIIAGVSSAGMPGENGPGTYGAIEHYTRVSSYIDWIQKTMESPQSKNEITNNKINTSRKRMGQPKVSRGEGPLPGLGLMLMDEQGKIRIGGKADMMVPEAFRHVMFRPPSYLIALNNVDYDSLANFKSAFANIKKGEPFQIKFDIQGEIMEFEGVKG